MSDVSESGPHLTLDEALDLLRDVADSEVQYSSAAKYTTLRVYARTWEALSTWRHADLNAWVDAWLADDQSAKAGSEASE